MKKRIFLVAVIFLIAVMFYNYVDITATILSRTNYKEDAIEAIKINVEPEDKLGEIAAAALDSIFASRIDSESFSKEFRYVAVDAEAFHELSKNDKQYLVNYFKKYNDKIIYSSMAGLKKSLLLNPITNSCNGGILLSIDKIDELSKDKAVLQVSYHINKYQAEGYKCTLVYKNGKWEVQTVELRFIV